MANYTTTTLLDQIKRKAFIPTGQNTFTESDLLEIATDELHNTIVPAVTSTREEFYVVREQQPITAQLNTIPIPYRAIGMGLRELSVEIGGIERNMTRYGIEDKTYDDKQGIMYGYYLQNNNIHLLGNETGNLRMYYYLRPGSLVPTSEASQISSIDTATNTLTLNSIPTGYVPGAVVDIINHKPGFDTKVISNTIVSVNGFDVELQDALPTDNLGNQLVTIKDWLTLEDTSPVPQMPVEFYQYLAEAVTGYVAESLGDDEAYAKSQQRLQKMMTNAQRLISPRVDGQSKKFVPRRNRGYNSYNKWRW